MPDSDSLGTFRDPLVAYQRPLTSDRPEGAYEVDWQSACELGLRHVRWVPLKRCQQRFDPMKMAPGPLGVVSLGLASHKSGCRSAQVGDFVVQQSACVCAA